MSMMLAGKRQRRILGIASTGLPIYAISGSEGEENEGGESEAPKENESGASSTPAPEAPKMVTAEEHDTILRRMQAADKAKGELEKRLREIEDKDKSEVEKLKRDHEEMKRELAIARQEALSAKLSSEILKFPGFVWHDPEAVLRLVDMEMISVDAETSKVNGVKDALTKLAKDKPYLLKGKQGDGKTGDGNRGGASGASGHNPAGAGYTADKNKRRDKLAGKYKL